MGVNGVIGEKIIRRKAKIGIKLKKNR